MILDSMTPTTKTLIVSIAYVGAFLLLWKLYQQWHTRNTRPPLPPGPSPKLFIGNLTDMPTANMWETFAEWGKKYGDVVYANVLGEHIIYLNSFDAAWDLMEKRSAIYSDRNHSVMLGDLIGADWNFGFMRYSDSWRLARKMFHSEFNSTTTTKSHETVLRHVRAALVNLHSQRSVPIDHMMHMASSIVYEIIYGLEIQPKDDPFVKTSEEALTAFVAAVTPGAFLVEVIPILKYLPIWFPGAGFKRQAVQWGKAIDAMVSAPYAAAKKNFDNGENRGSFSAAWFDKLANEQDLQQKHILEGVVRNVCTTSYAAGFETTVSSFHDFFLAMILYPHVQQKAHKELDAIVGSNRLPEFSDRPNLPYIDAIYKEVMRWRPVFPLGIPHRLIKDDIYKGMFLPGGSQIIANQWAMLQNEDDFGPNPAEFNPERFLKPGVKDPEAAFGFGRRKCPGRYMVADTLFITIASILHTSKFSLTKDEAGNDIPVSGRMTCAITVQPERFPFTIEPRSPAALEFIHSLQEH